MKKMKRLIGIMISTIMLVSSCYSYASPVDFSIEETNLLSNNDAEQLGISFIKNIIETDSNINWNYNTKISSIIPMYDTEGNINSYSLELNNKNESNG